MTSLGEMRPKRKVLSLKKDKPEAPEQPCLVHKSHALYMVWRVGGDMPKRVYQPHERDIAIGHAKKLCDETGQEFHVLRSFRAYVKAPE